MKGCAFEELIGFHGGLGGAQTHPFVIHPVELKAPDGELIGAASVHQLAKSWLIDLHGEPAGANGEAEAAKEELQPAQLED